MLFNGCGLISAVLNKIVSPILDFARCYWLSRQEKFANYEYLTLKMKEILKGVSSLQSNNDASRLVEKLFSDEDEKLLCKLMPEIAIKYSELKSLLINLPLKDYTWKAKREIDFEYLTEKAKNLYFDTNNLVEQLKYNDCINIIQRTASAFYAKLLSVRENSVIDKVGLVG